MTRRAIIEIATRSSIIIKALLKTESPPNLYGKEEPHVLLIVVVVVVGLQRA